MKRVTIGNVFNHLMIERYAEAHSAPLKNASARKIWLARNGDIIATQRPVSSALLAHVSRVTGLATDAVKCLDISDDPRVLKADILAASGNEPVELAPYALERWIVALSEKLGGVIEFHDGTPGPALVDEIYRLNTKSGFRSVAVDLGLPVPDGRSVEGKGALRKTCHDMLRHHEKIIVKLDRSSNGYGNLVLSQQDMPAIGDRLEEHFSQFRDQPDAFMVEQFLSFVALPSIEMTVESSGLRFDYICDQRTDPKAGMITPPRDLPKHAQTSLERAGHTFGGWLARLGYRGVFDIDGGCTADGMVFFTETNARRTAGSHLHDIAKRLVGADYLANVMWLSGSVELSKPRPLNYLEKAVECAGLLFDATERSGFIFPVDHPAGERCFYQIFAGSTEEAQDMENRLHTVAAE